MATANVPPSQNLADNPDAASSIQPAGKEPAAADSKSMPSNCQQWMKESDLHRFGANKDYQNLTISFQGTNGDDNSKNEDCAKKTMKDMGKRGGEELGKKGGEIAGRAAGDAIAPGIGGEIGSKIGGDLGKKAGGEIGEQAGGQAHDLGQGRMEFISSGNNNGFSVKFSNPMQMNQFMKDYDKNMEEMSQTSQLSSSAPMNKP